MAQTIQISQTKFDELVRRMARLESMMTKLLAKNNMSDIPMVDEETEKMIAKGMEDYKKGRYTTISTEKELDIYLKNL